VLSISKKTDYGLLLLKSLSQIPKGKYVSIGQIARTNHLPYKYLSGIATDLKTAGILESKEGTKGGYHLKVNPQNLMLSDILQALEGELVVSCGQKNLSCSCNSACLHESVMQKVLGGIEDYSLADLLRS